MKKQLRPFIYLSLLLVLGCSFDQLPGRKSLRECPKPSAVFQFIVDPVNPLRYTIKLDKVAGEAETVLWTVANSIDTRKPGDSFTFSFTQPGSYPIKAVLQNMCNNNTTLEQTLVVTVNKPAVATGRTEAVTPTSATVLMVVSSAGSTALTQQGIVFGTETNTAPTLANGGIFVAAPANSRIGDSLRVVIPGLVAGRRYNYRAYALNTAGDSYGDPARQFVTPQPVAVVDTWLRTIGGSGADFGYAVLTLPDTGFLIVGNSASSNGDLTGNKGSYDAWVARLDLNGTVVWQKNLGGSGDDVLWAAQLMPDGNYLMLGNTTSPNVEGTNTAGGSDVWVVKMNPSGGLVYSRTYGTSATEFGFNLSVLANGDYAYTGTTQVGTAIGTGTIRLIAEPTNTLRNTFNLTDSRYYGICTVPSGGFVAVGSAGSNSGVPISGNVDLLVTRLTSTLTQNGGHLPLGGSDDDGANHVILTSDGGYLVVGQSKVSGNTPTNAASDMYMVKLNPSGQVEWSKKYGGSGNDLGQGAVQTPDGGYIIVGSTTSNDRDVSGNYGNTDVWVIKLDGSGNKVWAKTYGGSGDDYGYKITATKDGGYLIVGDTKSNNGDVSSNKGISDVLVMKIDGSGKLK